MRNVGLGCEWPRIGGVSDIGSAGVNDVSSGVRDARGEGDITTADVFGGIMTTSPTPRKRAYIRTSNTTISLIDSWAATSCS